jgi:hypothetical protein
VYITDTNATHGERIYEPDKQSSMHALLYLKPLAIIFSFRPFLANEACPI